MPQKARDADDRDHKGSGSAREFTRAVSGLAATTRPSIEAASAAISESLRAAA